MYLFRTLGSFMCYISLGLTFVFADELGDWRLELLKEQGLPTETEALERLQKEQAHSLEGFEQAITQLGSEKFKEREEAQKKIELMGKNALPAIRDMEKSDDPEVRFRLKQIVQIFEAEGRWKKDDLVKQAIAGLLLERQQKEVVDAPQDLFVEFFNKAAPSLKNEYRRLRFLGKDGLVVDGVAHLKNAGVESDQRLILDSKMVTGKAEFPDTFRIEVKLGAQPGGEGIFHIGVAVGNVRSLFHAGYRSGAFRLERVDNHIQIKQNTDMGFDPPSNKLLLMCIDVKRQPNGNVALNVTVNDGKKRFNTHQVIKAADIGKLDTISLDRSGHGGGDALFDDLIVDMKNR
jgi:hypothetical protein